jgi:hypothetical protein
VNSETLVVVDNPQHHRLGDRIVHILGGRTSFPGAPAPVLGIVEVGHGQPPPAAF